MKNQKGFIEEVGVLLVGLLILLFVGAMIFAGFYRSTHHDTVHFTVKRLEILPESSKSSGHQYMVYTDNGVYKITDSLLNNKFNSSDLFASLETGKTYNCDVTGYRNGYISEYQNIVSCVEGK